MVVVVVVRTSRWWWWWFANARTALLNGFIAGLAGITPASGYIQSYWAALLGVVLGLASWYSIILMKTKLHVDDALDVSSVHGLTGMIGAYAIAIFKDTSVNTAGRDGVLNGEYALLWIQLVGIVVAVAWAVFWTSVFCVVAHYVPLLRLRVKDEHEELGWDKSKGLQAYLDLHSRENTVRQRDTALGDGSAHRQPHIGGDDDSSSDDDDGGGEYQRRGLAVGQEQRLRASLADQLLAPGSRPMPVQIQVTPPAAVVGATPGSYQYYQ